MKKRKVTDVVFRFFYVFPNNAIELCPDSGEQMNFRPPRRDPTALCEAAHRGDKRYPIQLAASDGPHKRLRAICQTSGLQRVACGGARRVHGATRRGVLWERRVGAVNAEAVCGLLRPKFGGFVAKRNHPGRFAPLHFVGLCLLLPCYSFLICFMK